MFILWWRWPQSLSQVLKLFSLRVCLRFCSVCVCSFPASLKVCMCVAALLGQTLSRQADSERVHIEPETGFRLGCLLSFSAKLFFLSFCLVLSLSVCLSVIIVILLLVGSVKKSGGRRGGGGMTELLLWRRRQRWRWWGAIRPPGWV